MKIKQTIVISVFSIIFGAMVSNPAEVALADTTATSTCGGVTTAIISCSQTSKPLCPDGKTRVTLGDKCPDGTTPTLATQDSGVWGILLFVLKIMTAGVGIVAVGGIVYGSILYTTAADKAEQTKKAIGVITNVVIGIIAYGLMFLILNFLIPGGLFNTTP